jgi:RNA polymerase sigma-70 factor (ECF subfamily)
MTEQSELKLIRDCLDGKTEAYGRLIDRYQKPIFNVVKKIVGDYDEASDVTQTVFVNAYQKLSSFDSQYKFFSWIYRMAVNESLNWLKQRKRQEGLRPMSASVATTPEQMILDREKSGQIDAALIDLSLDHRLAIVFRHFADLSYQEMSFVLGIPEKTVKSRLFSARRLLCDILKKRGVTPND